MFDSLGEKFEKVFRKLRGQKTLSEDNIKEAVREVRMALLEADVNYNVVRDFVNRVREKAVGEDVVRGVNPAQMLFALVHKELVAMMTGTPEEEKPFDVKPGSGTIIMLLGLQGAGKTTFSGKLARFLEKEKCRPLLVACDIYRPAAIEQLKQVGNSLSIPVFEMGTGHAPVDIVRAAQKQAEQSGRDTLIIDTAGRLHIDEVKMEELQALRDQIKPDYTFLVADAMTGQDAVNSAKAFHEQVGIDGVCLTKLDGDARGGAALSIRAVIGKPIVFVGVGEKPDDLERFHPERVAQRILGMGDVASLVEKAQEAMQDEDADSLRGKLETGKFNYLDFVKQMKMIQKMGSLKGLLGMLPGVGGMLKDVDNDVLSRELRRVEAMILSMTKQERETPELVRDEGGRRMRIAKGSGHSLKQVNELVRQFEQMRSMMAQMAGGGMFGGLGGLMGAKGKMDPKAILGAGGADPTAGINPGILDGSIPPPPPGTPEHKKLMKQVKQMRDMQRQGGRPSMQAQMEEARRNLKKKKSRR